VWGGGGGGGGVGGGGGGARILSCERCSNFVKSGWNVMSLAKFDVSCTSRCRLYSGL